MESNTDSTGRNSRGDGPEAVSESETSGRQDGESPSVVGIGASAGGLNALRRFFEAVPSGTGLTFVVVVHLSPEHESSMAELLQTSASIPFVQVSGRTRMEPEFAYVIPPNRNLRIADGYLDVSEFEEPRSRRSPIDFFFRTMAETHPDCVAIVLSGGGTDGTIGMKAVKEQGGLLMAQLPEEAEHAQMPRSAIATGLVDFVLPADELAQKLVELRRNSAVITLPEKSEELDERHERNLETILTQVRISTGHDFSGYKHSTLLRRIGRRMRVTTTEDLGSYIERLRGDSVEAGALLKDFLISVTNFFRDQDSFDALAEHVMRKLFARDSPEEVRIWVPGCATGEEAYSLAILALEESERFDHPPNVQIFATDLDEDAIAFGRAGLYPDAIATDVSEERLRRFFNREGAYYRVREELRDCVLFAAHNLLKDPPFARLDLISCRNLLIYLGRDFQEKVHGIFHYALRPAGYLFLGSSESVADGAGLFDSIDKKHRIYRRVSAPSTKAIHLPNLPLQRRIRRIGITPENRPDGNSASKDATALEMHQRSLEAHAPPSALVDADYDIVHLSETAGRYLRIPGGSGTLSILKVVRQDLRVELRAAIDAALERNEATIGRPVPVHIEGERRLVQIHVRPVRDDASSPHALILFVEGEPHDTTSEPVGAAMSDAQLRRYEDDLDRTKRRLQSTIEESETRQEELRAANEELLSINEEYKSTLEELETSQEELQSINEELKTLNDELKEKVDELSRANNDLKNLMAATDVAILFLDRNLRIRRYTQPLTRVFNIMPADEGRPLNHVTHRLNYEALHGDAENVLATLIPLEREVADSDGRTYLLRITPYRTTEDRIIGLVLTLVDVTSLKEAEEEQHRIYQRYDLLMRSVKEYAIFTIGTEGQITSWNAGAARLFGYSDDEALGQQMDIIFTEDARSAGTPQEEMAAAKANGRADDEGWHTRKNGDRFWASGTLEALYDTSGTLQGFAKMLRDETQRRESARALEESRDRLEQLNEDLERRVESRTVQLSEAHDRVRQLASELVKAEQRERHRIAQILHDDLQQRLYGIQMKTSLLRKEVESSGSDRVLQHVAFMEKQLEETIEQTRDLAVDLSPPILKNEGLAETLGWLASQMRDRHGLEVTIDAEDSVHMEDESLRTLMFRTVRELLFNVVKHAGVDHAIIELGRDGDEVVVRVHDDGSGFRAEDARDDADSGYGFGLSNVRERLNFVGGRLQIDSAPGEGTHIVVRIPTAV